MARTGPHIMHFTGNEFTNHCLIIWYPVTPLNLHHGTDYVVLKKNKSCDTWNDL